MQEIEVSTIRRFVLGDLDEVTRREIEREALADDDLFDRIESVEDELIEDYLAGELPASERRIFEETLDSIPGRRRRVAISKSLAARGAATTAPGGDVVNIKDRLRYANHARFALAAGFAAAAITAVVFFQARDASPERPSSALPVAATTTPSPRETPVEMPETSSALAARRPGTPVLAAPTPAQQPAVAVPVVTFLLTAGATRSDDGSPELVVENRDAVVDIQIAVEDNDFSHYNAELRAPDGSTLSSHRDVPVTALDGAPVLRLEVPASRLRDGRHELVLAGIHESGTEEVAYIEFDVRAR